MHNGDLLDCRRALANNILFAGYHKVSATPKSSQDATLIGLFASGKEIRHTWRLKVRGFCPSAWGLPTALQLQVLSLVVEI